MNRRQFILSSTTFALGAGFRANASGYGGFAGLAAQAPAQPAPPGHQVRRPPPRRRHVHRHRRHDRLSGERRWCDRRRQPVHEQRHHLRGGAEAARAEGHRDAAQHAPSRRPHRRQQGLRREQDRRQENCLASHKKVTEEAKTVADQAYATATFGDSWSEKFGDEKMRPLLRPGHTGGDAVFHFQRANVMHMGDLLFNRAHPSIDRAQGARSTTGSRCSRRCRKRASNDTIFIVGHAKDNNVRNTKSGDACTSATTSPRRSITSAPA